ncbi:MAG: class I SAM-dependent methyltransferase, partial [Bacteroidota bacterium]
SVSKKDSSAETPLNHQPLSWSPHISDAVGWTTLETIAQAPNFNRWMASLLCPFLKSGSTLEIGAGIGNISQHILASVPSLTVSDMRSEYLEILRHRFHGDVHFAGSHKLDIQHEGDVANILVHQSPFDNVFALNVVEHIENDQQALQNCHRLLTTGGRLIILVPAFPLLFNTFDQHLGHFRRYTRQSLCHLIQSAGFRVIHSQYFNLLGILGWMVSGTLLRRKQIPTGQMKGFDRVVPFLRKIDPLFHRLGGLSVCCVGEKLPS